MKNYIFTIFFLLSISSIAQQQNINYNNLDLHKVFVDLGKRFDVHFSYNSSLLANKKITFSDKADLDLVLLEISSQHDLKIEYLDSSNIIVTQFDKFDKKAFNEFNFLNEVIVTSEYLTSGFDQDKKDGTLSLQPDKLGVLPGLTEPDVMQSLQMLPGISSPSESASNLHIRGGTPDQNLILFDGIKMYHQGHLFGMISPFNPYITKRVDIYRSGTSAKYGDRISGVVNMKTADEIPEKIKGGAGVHFLHTDAFVRVPVVDKKVGIALSMRKSLTDFLDSYTYNAMRNKVFQNTKIKNFMSGQEEEEELKVLDDKFSFFDTNAKVIIKPNESHTVSLGALLIDNSLKHATADEDMEGSRDHLKLNNKGVSVNWTGQITEKWEAKAKAYHSYYSTDYLYNQFEEKQIEEKFTRENDISDTGVNAAIKTTINDENVLTFGAEWSYLNVTYNLLKTGDNSYKENKDTGLNTQSIFAEYEYRSDNLYIRAGLRGNSFKELGSSALEPRIYADYRIDERWKIKASAEIKNQAISQLVSFKFNNLGLDDTFWALTNKEIPILNNKQFTAGFMFSENGWKIDVESYYKAVSGLSSFTRGFNVSNKFSAYTSGESNVFGADVLVKKRIGNFRTWVGYSISKNDFKFEKISNLHFPGNYDQRHIVSWSNTYKYNDFQFSLGWQYKTGKPYTKATLKNSNAEVDDDEPVNTSLITYGKINGSRLPSYHRLDLSAIYDFYLNEENAIKARIGVSVMNAYNQKNTIDKRFKAEIDKEQERAKLVEQTTIGLRMTPNVVFRVYF